MKGQSDGALRVTLRKVYSNIPAMPSAELRRRLLMIPELFYFADELIAEGWRRGILVPATNAVVGADNGGPLASPPPDVPLAIVDADGNLEGWPYTDRG